MRYTLTREIESLEFDIDVEVSYVYHRAYKGARDSIGGVRNAGPPLEPDEPAYIEITSVKGINDGQEYELTPDEQSDIEAEISELMSSPPEDDWRDDR
jgi:hypothetical protein